MQLMIDACRPPHLRGHEAGQRPALRGRQITVRPQSLPVARYAGQLDHTCEEFDEDGPVNRAHGVRE